MRETKGETEGKKYPPMGCDHVTIPFPLFFHLIRITRWHAYLPNMPGPGFKLWSAMLGLGGLVPLTMRLLGSPQKLFIAGVQFPSCIQGQGIPDK